MRSSFGNDSAFVCKSQPSTEAKLDASLASRFQQSSHDGKPFLIQGLPADRLACASVPVRRVTLISFFAVEIGVYPRTLDAFIFLSEFVRSRPITLGIPPQSFEGGRESGWRLGSGE